MCEITTFKDVATQKLRKHQNPLCKNVVVFLLSQLVKMSAKLRVHGEIDH